MPPEHVDLMKILRHVIGLLLALGAGCLAGTRAADAQFSAPPKKDAPDLADKGRNPGSGGAPQAEAYGPHSIEDMVQIVQVSAGKPDASGRCLVTVQVRYALVHHPKGMLSLGFNLKSATQFVQVGSQPVMAGAEGREFSATITPVEWSKKQPFAVRVGLLAEPHPGQWSLLAVDVQALKLPSPAPAR